MYKIVIQYEQKNKDVSSLIANEVTNKDTTKFEKATGSIIRDYVQKALKEFKKDNDMDSYDELDDVLKDLLDYLKNLKETMKDKKKED